MHDGFVRAVAADDRTVPQRIRRSRTSAGATVARGSDVGVAGKLADKPVYKLLQEREQTVSAGVIRFVGLAAPPGHGARLRRDPRDGLRAVKIRSSTTRSKRICACARRYGRSGGQDRRRREPGHQLRRAARRRRQRAFRAERRDQDRHESLARLLGGHRRPEAGHERRRRAGDARGSSRGRRGSHRSGLCAPGRDAADVTEMVVPASPRRSSGRACAPCRTGVPPSGGEMARRIELCCGRDGAR